MSRCALVGLWASCLISSFAQAAEVEAKPELPEEIQKKLPEDSAKLFALIGRVEKADDKNGEDLAPVRFAALKVSDFDEDKELEWQIHYHTLDAAGGAVSGCLVYDLAESGWTCVARLRGTFPQGWGELVKGRYGIKTLEAVQGAAINTERVRFYRYTGTEYVEDHVEFNSGG